MDLRFDREIMKWFDSFFQEAIESISIDNFFCKTERNSRLLDRSRKFILEKNNGKYWQIEFTVPESKVLKIEKNVNTFFKEYIIEEISMYSDDEIYDFINSKIKDVYNEVVEYRYNEDKNTYVMSYSKEFMDKCSGMKVGEIRFLNEDLMIKIWNEEKISIVNIDNTFNLILNYDTNKNEDMLDSLLDLRKSVIIIL
ncbi:hypothetical protein [Peptostreptococcus equinus]|uniref:Uncharacterized protein n=1 Tax=Peptostreptococcus equinus TaxID=3003601 RepID=A0ABY7JUN7_9FIRM|nr:hypothetical protein [Peptostreptococcus sp. CBA3647]WAW15690.1 hypothetical protein O0R46_04370 [Peptostreptococcus sp. CBA3647]